MWFHSLVASWKSGASRSRRPQAKPACRRTQLTLEHLEDRDLPSSYSAATVSDLIADINAANKAGGANRITLTAPTTSPYALTAVNNTTNGANGLPVIAAHDNLTILGNGDTIKNSTGNNGVALVDFRLLDVASGASLMLQNLTLEGGLAFAAGIGNGGAVYNQGALTLSGVTAFGNRAYGGGPRAGAGGAIWSNGSLTLENGTLLTGNNARGGTYGGWAFGGAVYVAGGTANVTNTTLTSNSATALDGGYAFGGALYVAGGQVILTAATLNGNGTISATAPSARGGALYVAGGTVTLAIDTVESNTALGAGGGLFIAQGATVYIDTFTLAHVINNTAPFDPNIDGTYIET